MNNKIKIKNLDCPNCALELEGELKSINGVSSCNVDYINQIVFIDCDEKVLDKAKNIINNFESVKVVEENNENISYKNEIIKLSLAGILFIISIIIKSIFELDYYDFSLFTSEKVVFYILLLASSLIAFVLVLKDIFVNVIKNLAKGNFFDENFLMLIASIGAIIIGEVDEGIMVLLLYELGELLQNIAVSNSRKSIKSLMDLKVDTITKINGFLQSNVKVEDLEINDIVLIKKGEKVPVDIIIIEGESSFDTKALTGEAIYKELGKNDEVLSGFINVGNIIKGRVIRKYQDSAIKRILDLVENSSLNKSNSEKFITKFAKYYTPIVCFIALIIGIVVPTILGINNGMWLNNYQEWGYRALILLVISCPCALIISVPLTYFNGIGVASKNGILVKGTIFLDELNNIDTICLDKTGTLTKGVFNIVDVIGNDRDNILKIAASLEKNSTHPISIAFKDMESDLEIEDFEELSSRGLKGIINGKKYLIGNERLLKEHNIKFEKIESESVVLYLIEDEKLIGIIKIDDVLKDNINNTLVELRKDGIKKIVMLTGDSKSRSISIESALNLDEAYCDLLPQDKLNICKDLQSSGKVLFVGDGINDAPVLMIANIGVSMGQLGSEMAIEASDLILINDSLQDLIFARKVAKKNKNIVIQNIVFSIACKVLFMVLGVLNIIPLSFAVFADVGVMLIAILNSLRMNLLKK